MRALDKEIKMVEKIIKKQKEVDLATDKFIDKLKREKRELIIEIAGLRSRGKLFKAQLRKFGEIFDNYNNNKKEKVSCQKKKNTQ